MVELEAVVVEAVPVVRGVAPLVDLASSNMEALRLVPWLGGGADGRDGEEAHHFGGAVPVGLPSITSVPGVRTRECR